MTTNLTEKGIKIQLLESLFLISMKITVCDIFIPNFEQTLTYKKLITREFCKNNEL